MAKEKKKKDGEVHLKLPSAWQTMKKSRDTAQAKANYEGIIKVVGIIVVGLLVLFIFTGGISQKGLLMTVVNWSKTVIEKVGNWVNGIDVDVTDDGVYLKKSEEEKENFELDTSLLETLIGGKEDSNTENSETTDNTETAENVTEAPPNDSVTATPVPTESTSKESVQESTEETKEGNK